MSYEKDYLMRQMMQLFEVLAKILRFRKKGEKEKAEEQIKYFYSCLKVDTNRVKMPIEDLLEHLEQEKKFSLEQIELFAFVLKEQGELTTDESFRFDCFRKAHFLLEKIERESIAFSMDRQMKLGELKSYLN